MRHRWEELFAETRTQMSDALVKQAWQRIVLTDRVSREALDTFVGAAKAAGFMRDAPDLSRLVETP